MKYPLHAITVMACESLKGVMSDTAGAPEEMREKSDDDICFPGDKIPDRSASRNVIDI